MWYARHIEQPTFLYNIAVPAANTLFRDKRQLNSKENKKKEKSGIWETTQPLKECG